MRRLENDISSLQDSILQTQESLKETQRYLIKLAHQQAETNKRLMSWPYLKITSKREDV